MSWPKNWPEGYGRRVLARLDSTNAEARRISSEIAGPEWVLALEQTAGRGRRGRNWVFPAGNFAATLVMPTRDAPEMRALRSFVAALALADALAEIGLAGIALKWPNDVLVSGGKLAGILLESWGDHLAIGIGVNLVAAPEVSQVEAGALRPVSVLAESGLRVSPEQMLEALARAYAAREAQFVTYGFAPIRTAWLAQAAGLGQPITARTGTDTHHGTFETVDETGQLVLKTPKGRETIAAGDVFF